jgi:hypothetical protein
MPRQTASSAPSSRFFARRLSWGQIAAFVVPLPLVFLAVLNVAYSSGDMLDLGWLSRIAWHNDLSLTGPPASFNESFFLHHVSPIFWLSGLLSYIQPLGRLDYYAALLGLIYALYAAGIYRAWTACDVHPPKVQATLLGIFLALLATFSAVGMQALRLPHFEMAIPALALWFFLMVTEERYRAALFWFVLCLLVREDAGFHLFGLLALWGLALAITHRKDPRRIWIRGFAAFALLYSLGALFIQGVLFPGTHKFSQIYAGDPAWAHITLVFIKERLSFFLTQRTTITLPLLVTIGWAFFARNPLLPLGYLAFIPWVALNLMAVQITAGSLNFYYMFPFWISLGWPLLALRLWPEAKAQRWPWLFVLLFSLIGWNKDGFIVYPLAKNDFDTYPFSLTDDILNRKAADAFAAYFAAHKELFEGRVDMPVFSLLIDTNDRLNWLATGHRYMSDPPPEAPPLPEIVIYYNRSFEEPLWVDPVLKTGAYHYFYQVPGTRIRLAAEKSLDAFPDPKPFVLIAKPAF